MIAVLVMCALGVVVAVVAERALDRWQAGVDQATRERARCNSEGES